ncbi:hypothetical protein CBR_g46382 [Chara braunii]|uniref:CCHC-type domain-containing protein n=1 Tax=Chara braunii TaxID=69332 RepID=A0A388M0E9_CHABU|nr:hypothetical protein CBR_g46382 [Chara braunii]|eukprot:GBG88011.1 hypothetical protein CBR_g46382 [Chara braunii]
MNHEVLMVPDPQKPFIVTTHPSQYGIGAVLAQQDGKKLRPIEYMSKKMPSKKLAKSTYERELYALYKALVHWRHFLLGRFFYLRTDHQTLKWIKTQPALSDALKRWIEVIDQYDFTLEYLKGEYNKVADALSRRADYLGALVSDFGISDEVTQSLVGAYQEDPVTMDIIRKHQAKDKATESEFVMVDGLLYLDKAGIKRLVVPSSEPLRSLFLGECLDATGHFGYKKTSANLVQRFWWPGMFDDVKKYVETCQGPGAGNKMARWLSPPTYTSGPEMPVDVKDGVSVVLPEDGAWTDLEPAYQTVMLEGEDAFLWIETVRANISLTRLSRSLMDLEFRGTVEARGWVYLSQDGENAMVVELALGNAPDELFRKAKAEVVWATCQRREMEMERVDVRVELGDRGSMRRPVRTMRCVLPPFLVDAVFGTRSRLAQVSRHALPPQEAVVPPGVANRGFRWRDPANEQCKYCTAIGHYERACPKLNHDIMKRRRCTGSLKGEIFGPQGERVNWNSPGGMRRAIIMLNGLEITVVEAELVGKIIWDQLRGRGPQVNFILENDGRDRVNATTRLGTAGRRINRDTIMEEVAGSSEPQAEPEAEEPEKVYGKPREEEPADKVTTAKKKFWYQIPILTLPELDDTISKLLGTMVSVSFQTMLQASPRLLKGLRQLLTRRRVEIRDNPELPEGEREEEAPQEVANLQRSHGDLEDLEKAFADIRLSLPDQEGGEVMRSPPGTKLSFHALPVGKLKIQIGSHHTDALETRSGIDRQDITVADTTAHDDGDGYSPIQTEDEEGEEKDVREVIEISSGNERDEISRPREEGRPPMHQPGDGAFRWEDEFGPTPSHWFQQWTNVIRHEWIINARELARAGVEATPLDFFNEAELRKIVRMEREIETFGLGVRQSAEEQGGPGNGQVEAQDNNRH